MANFTGYENSTVNKTDIISWSTYSTSMAFLSGLNIFLAITASLGNALILIALHKVTSIHPPTKLLFRCLALADLCVGLTAQPLYVIYLVSLLPMNMHHLDRIIQASDFLFCLLVQVSLLTSTTISVDRLLALLLGLRYRHVVTLRRVYVVVVSFWLICALDTAVLMFFVDETVSYIADLTTHILIILSLVVSTFSYTKIFFTLRHQQAQIQDHTQPGQPNGGGNPLNIARYKKTVSSIAWVQLALLVCYAPYNITALVNFEKEYYSTAMSIVSESFVTLFYLNSSLNPILYCWKIRDVRQEVKNIIHQVCCCSS